MTGMHSIRTKFTILTVCVLVVALTVTTVLAAFSIKNLGTDSSERILELLCDTGAKNLNAYFDSVEQSAKTIYDYAEADLGSTDIEKLGEHIARVEDFFEKTAKNTSGVLTYYYRIDPEVSSTEKGFWYVSTGSGGFAPHAVTDITLYDTEDQTKLIWFTVPKATGSSIWLPPYITENLNAYVLSYNVPVYKDGGFIGVIGIEIDYNTIVQPVNSITLYKNGYAFINDVDGTIIYHPHMNVANYTGENKPKVPDGLLSESTNVRYVYEGVAKQAVWTPLHNGMRLNVTVPVSEINSEWQQLINKTVAVSLVMLLIVVILTAQYVGHVTTPLRKLTDAAKQVDAGNYDFKPEYSGNDEVGILTRTFAQLTGHLKTYISNLNSLAYFDSLTSVQNKGAFDLYINDMKARIEEQNGQVEFAVAIFDCNGLKRINDQYGHDKGNIFLKNASLLICQVFTHSPVFRTGGDEFAVVMQNDDFKNRDELIRLFERKISDHNASASEQWEKVSVAVGVAAYEPGEDSSVDEVIHRADQLMYQNKRKFKSDRQNTLDQPQD